MELDEFLQRFPLNLNLQQTEALKTVQGPVLLLAVPGSGKTTVLVARLGYMILCKKIQPERIMTITYTVAAAKDMKARFASIFGGDLAERLEFRTINSLCVKVISWYSGWIGKRPFRLVTDEKELSYRLSQIYQQIEHDYPYEADLKTVRTWITYIKNMMLTEDEIKQIDQKEKVKLSQIYREYNRLLRSNSMMDYDDQLVYAHNILQRSPEALSFFQQQYPYVCVDEAQDTSKIQHKIIALLSSKTENLFMVGDEDQSIYGFRAAYPNALLYFEQEHPGARVLVMEQNFRSNANIVAAADAFIQQNQLRHAKSMKAVRPAGMEVKRIEMRGRNAQYSYLMKVAKDCKTQTAVLYRNNESAIPLVDLLDRNNIPYRLRNTDAVFFAHRTVLDIVSILRLAVNPKDTESFMKVYYKLGLYVTKEAALRICHRCRQQNRPVLDTAIKDDAISANVVRNLKAMKTHLSKLLEERADKAIFRIVKHMGYGEYLQQNNISHGKISILKILGSRTESIPDFLRRLDILQDILKNKSSDPQCPFVLSTIHASKGLEYDTVYLVDVADGLFPETVPERYPEMSSEEQLVFEEERRLFYVGVTRSVNHLRIFSCSMESVFQNEFFREQTIAPENKETLKKREIPQNNPSDFAEGVMVEHIRFGIGKVISYDGHILTVQYDEGVRLFDVQIVLQKKLLWVVE